MNVSTTGIHSTCSQGDREIERAARRGVHVSEDAGRVGAWMVPSTDTRQRGGQSEGIESLIKLAHFLFSLSGNYFCYA